VNEALVTGNEALMLGRERSSCTRKELKEALMMGIE
jgi:hypothetical protein